MDWFWKTSWACIDLLQIVAYRRFIWLIRAWILSRPDSENNPTDLYFMANLGTWKIKICILWGNGILRKILRVPALPNPSTHVAESASLSVRNLDTNRSYEYFPYALSIDGSVAGISLGNLAAPQAKFGELLTGSFIVNILCMWLPLYWSGRPASQSLFQPTSHAVPFHGFPSATWLHYAQC